MLDICGSIYDGFPLPSTKKGAGEALAAPATGGPGSAVTLFPVLCQHLFTLSRGVCASFEGCMETVQPLSMTDLF